MGRGSFVGADHGTVGHCYLTSRSNSEMFDRRFPPNCETSFFLFLFKLSPWFCNFPLILFISFLLFQNFLSFLLLLIDGRFSSRRSARFAPSQRVAPVRCNLSIEKEEKEKNCWLRQLIGGYWSSSTNPCGIPNRTDAAWMKALGWRRSWPRHSTAQSLM